MRCLTLIRHGKSDWQYRTLTDSERPLNDRGRRDVPVMAMQLAATCCCPVDCLLSSYATRALTTARLFADALALPVSAIRLSQALADNQLSAIMDELRQCARSHQHIALVGHNPSLEQLTGYLLGSEQRLPTAAVLQLQLDISDWQQLAPEPCRLLRLDTPRSLRR